MLILGTGSNQGNSLRFLSLAEQSLSRHFQLVAKSRIYISRAVDYREQPDFYNQVLQFISPPCDPENIFDITMSIELRLGRKRNIPKGPRTIDIDLLFLETKPYRSKNIILPHPRALERSFVVRPLQELPYCREIQKYYSFPERFEIESSPLGQFG